MKAKSILIIILMTVIPILASAQAKSGDDSAPSNAPAAADSLLPDPGPTNVPAGPGSLGPEEVLQEYQTVMVVITQNFTANLAGITEPVQEGKNEQRGRQDLNRRAVPHCQDAIPAA